MENTSVWNEVLRQIVVQDPYVLDFIQHKVHHGISVRPFNASEMEWYNTTFATTLGINITNPLNTPQLREARIYLEDLVSAKQELVLANEKDHFQYDFRIQRENQAYIKLRCHAYVAKNEKGEKSYLVKIYEKLNQHQITESNEMFHFLSSLVESQEIFLTKIDLNGKFSFVNNYYAQYLGIKPEDLLGKPSLSHIHPSFQEGLREIVYKCILEPSVAQRIVLVKNHLDGYELTSRWEMVASVDANGDVMGIICMGYDISEGMHSNKAYRDLVANMGDAVLKMTASGKFTYVSPPFQSKYGYPAKEILGQSFQDIIHPHDTPKVLIKIGKLFSTQSSPGALMHRLKNKAGDWKWVETNGSIDPHTGEVILIIRDATEKKAQLSQLKMQSNMLEAVSQSVIMFDTEWRVQYWNKGAEKLFGWKKEEVIGGILPTGTMTPQSTREDSIRIMKQLQDGIPWEGEFLVKNKEGEEFTALVSNNAVYDDYGKLLGYIGISTDITPSKQSEENLLRNKQQLELAIDTAKLGIWELNVESGILEWNDELLSIYELTREEWQRDLQGFRKRVFPEDLVIADRDLQKISEGKVIHDVRFRIQTPEGKVKHIYASGAPIYDNQGKIVKLMGINIDVTPVVEYELALQETENRFKAFANNVPGMVYIKYPAGKHIFGNQRMLNRFKVTLDEYRQSQIEDLLPLEYSAQSNQLEEEVHAKKKSFVREVYDFENDQWLQEIKFPIDDQVIGGILVDITDRKQTEIQLSKVAQQLQNIVESISDAFFSVDKEGTFVYMNRKAGEILALDPDDVIGKDVGGELPTWWQETLTPHFVKVKQRQSFESIEAYCEDLDSWFEFHIYPAKAGLSVFFLEITEQKRAEIALIESELKYRNITDNLPGAVLRYKLTPEGKQSLMFLSQGAEKVWEIDWEEAFLNVEKLWSAIHPDDKQGMEYTVLESAEKLIPWNYEWRIIMPDGRIKWLNGKGVPNRMEEGSTVWDTLILDITDKKETEAVRLFAEQVERENKEMEQFAYIASHDLQEPMRTIQNFVVLLNDNYKEELDSEARLYLKFITDASNRMIELIKGLLDFSRLGKKRKIVDVDMSQLVASVLNDLAVLIEKSGAQILMHQLPKIQGAELGLRLLFQNLITNAIKFAKEGEPPMIEISAEPISGGWRFRVSDNGIGIQARHQKKIFHIFQRLHPVERYEGTGIGLAHCKKIVELHNGEIWVESEPGIGSQFFFTIKSPL